jgi:hypothetical protein
MKKILLIIALIMVIFQLVVMATAIYMGSEAEDRATINNYPTFTIVPKDNPAGATGTITSIEIWTYTNLIDCEVAIFSASGNNLTCRDYETLDNGNGAGVVVAGSKQTFAVTLSVVSGDYLGIHSSIGKIEKTATGGANWWYLDGDYIPCEANTTFTNNTNPYIYSLKGIGATPATDNAIFFGINF